MKVIRNWILWVLLPMIPLSTWAYPPGGYSLPNPGAGLGIRVIDLPFVELDRLKLEHGVRVLEIAPQGPAAEAGVLPGDILIALNGRPTYSVARLRWILSNSPSSDRVDLELVRGGDRLTLKSQLMAPQRAFSGQIRPDYSPPPTRTYLGVYLQEMTEDLREAFGAPKGDGVLIAGVMDGSPAEEVGLKAGDVVVKMDRKSIMRIDDVHRVLAYFDPGEQMQIEIVRATKSLELTVPLQERPKLKTNTDWTRDRSASEYWNSMLPPPEYWRRMMDGMLESLENNLGDIRRSWSEDGREFY